MDECGFEVKSTADDDVHLPERLAASKKLEKRAFVRAKVAPDLVDAYGAHGKTPVQATLATPEDHARAYALAEEYGLLTRAGPSNKRDTDGESHGRLPVLCPGLCGTRASRVLGWCVIILQLKSHSVVRL